MDVTGDFETQGTPPAPRPGSEERTRHGAERHGLTYTRVVVDRGATPPVLTLRGRGALPAQRVAAERCRDVGRPEARQRPGRIDEGRRR